MLSNPLLVSSGGSSAAESTSMAKSSLIDAAYSARLSRCNATLPGFGAAAAAASSDVSSHDAKASAAARSGCLAAGRRHHAALEFLDRFFPDVAVFRQARQVHRVECDAGNLVVDVVAVDAVLIEEGFARAGSLQRLTLPDAEWQHRRKPEPDTIADGNDNESLHFHLKNSADFTHVIPQSRIRIGDELFRISPLRIEFLCWRRSHHGAGRHPFFHHVEE